MRRLKRLIPKEWNDSPTFEWVVVAIGVLVGVFLVVKGIDGFKHKRFTGKHGRVFEGTTAQVLGIVYVVLGPAMIVIVIVVKLGG